MAKDKRLKKAMARRQKDAEKRLAAAWRNIFVKAGILKP